MADKMIYADDLTACPECGSVVFWLNYTGGDEGAEIMSMNCITCGAKYYGRNYYQQNYGKPKAGNKKIIKSEKE